MSSNAEHQKEHASGSGGAHEPPSEEQHQKWNAEFKQNFLDQYQTQHKDVKISSEQVWELYLSADELWHNKMREKRHEHHHQHQGHPPADHSSPPPHPSSTPAHVDETRVRINKELHQEFLDDFKTKHAATDKVDATQAWQLIEKVQHSKHTKLQAEQAKHGHKHGHKDHEQHQPPHNH